MIDSGFCCDAPRNRTALRRERVIDATRKLFIDNGFHATGIAQIARESGVAVGQLYRDFAAKEDIVAAIVDTDCRSFMAADSLRLAIEKGDEQQVRDWIRQFVLPDEDPDDGRLFAEIMAEAGRNARIAAIFDRTHNDVHRLMLAALDMLAPGAALTERRSALADVILTMSLGLLHHQIVRPKATLAPMVQAMLAIIDRDIDAIRGKAQAQAVPA